MASESNFNTSFIDNYSLCEQLGKGAFSTVYKAISKKDGKTFAVKVLTKNRIGIGKLDMKRMESEVSIAFQMNHPNIVSLYEVIETKLKIYLIMDLVEGGELFERIASYGSFSEEDSITVMTQLLEAVKYLHKSNVIHRDIKPENLLLQKGEKLHIMLADFGLSRILGNESIALTSCGTPYYTAPEVLQGRGYGSEVDMWAVGVVAYFLLGGYPPFMGDSLPEVVELITKCIYGFPSPYFDNISREAKDFISKLLVYDQRSRLTAEKALLHPWIKRTKVVPRIVLI